MTESLYPCLIVTVSENRQDAISLRLEELGSLALETRDATTMNTASAGELELVAGFASVAERDTAYDEMAATGDEVTVRKEDITDDSWRSAWRDHFKPVLLHRLQVITPWMEPPSTRLIPIVIDPGQAFGTGGHATTKTILTMLENRAEKASLPRRILDVGTGSGVLAIAAAKLGATEITAIDIDEESVRATDENAAVNNVSRFIHAKQGEARHENETWPLVLANLELVIFLKVHEDVAQCVEPGGTLIASGLLTEHVSDFTALFPDFKLIDRMDEGEWCALEMRRPR